MAERGRPTQYTEETDAKAEQYLIDYKKDSVIPSVVGLAIYLNVTTKTIYNWVEKERCSENFLHTLAAVDDKQHQVALNNGLTGEFTSAITKLVLHNHGYSEKQEISQDVNFAQISDEPLSEEEWETEHAK